MRDRFDAIIADVTYALRWPRRPDRPEGGFESVAWRERTVGVDGKSAL
jgi:hypothetical protein